MSGTGLGGLNPRERAGTGSARAHLAIVGVRVPDMGISNEDINVSSASEEEFPVGGDTDGTDGGDTDGTDGGDTDGTDGGDTDGTDGGDTDGTDGGDTDGTDS